MGIADAAGSGDGEAVAGAARAGVAAAAATGLAAAVPPLPFGSATERPVGAIWCAGAP
ncbi:MAG: hypothetical protein M1319_03475 [Chloroflexi bacterium]|nr:hypothetical protein [Chloroflexota bacterium]